LQGRSPNKRLTKNFVQCNKKLIGEKMETERGKNEQRKGQRNKETGTGKSKEKN
jgi:hypothetical protein